MYAGDEGDSANSDEGVANPLKEGSWKWFSTLKRFFDTAEGEQVDDSKVDKDRFWKSVFYEIEVWSISCVCMTLWMTL